MAANLPHDNEAVRIGITFEMVLTMLREEGPLHFPPTASILRSAGSILTLFSS